MWIDREDEETYASDEELERRRQEKRAAGFIPGYKDIGYKDILGLRMNFSIQIIFVSE